MTAEPVKCWVCNKPGHKPVPNVRNGKTTYVCPEAGK